MKKSLFVGMVVMTLMVFSLPALANVKVGGIILTDFDYLDRDKENARFSGVGLFVLKGEGNWGKNWGNKRGLIGNSLPAMLSRAMLNPFTNQIHNAQTYSFWFDLSYRFGPVTPHFIFGEMTSKNKFFDFDIEAKSRMCGFSIPIDLAKGLRLRPEFMWYDDGDFKVKDLLSENLGKYAIYGVQFQITF